MGRPKRNSVGVSGVGDGRDSDRRKPSGGDAGDASVEYKRLLDQVRHDPENSDPLPAAAVEWLDVVDWPSGKEFSAGDQCFPAIIRSVGGLVRSDESGVVLAQDQSLVRGGVRALLHIDRSAIVSESVLPVG